MSEANEDSEEAPSSPYSMTEEILKKRANKPEYGRTSTQLYAGLIACLSSVSFGTALGWSAPVTEELFKKERHYVTAKNFSLLVSMVPLGCSLGIGTCTLLMQQMGPKRTLVVVAPFYVMTWWLMLIPNTNLQIAGRFFLGFLGIVYSISGESLLHQTVHYAIRKYISVFHNSSMLFGVFMSNIWGTSLKEFWLTVCCGCLPIVHFILLMPAPESPVFLYATSHRAAAKSLAWYRGENNFTVDMAQIKRDWDVDRQDSDAYGYMLFSKVVYKGLFIVIALTFFQVTSGYFIFLFFNISVWTNGHVGITPVVDAGLVASLFLFSKILWGALYTVSSWNIKGLLVASCLMVSVELTLLGIFLFVDKWNTHVFVELDWFPIIVLAVFLFCFDMGLNFFPRVLLFEYMPFQVFRKCSSIVHTCYWLFCFFNVFTFATMKMYFPSYFTFFILAAFSYIGTCFSYFCVVEPTGRSLMQIQLELGGNPVGRRGAWYNQTKMMV